MTVGDASKKRLRRRFFDASLTMIFVAFVLLLLVRVLFVEPFVVTTGSMGPRILGVHRRCECPACGLPIIVGAGNEEEHYDHATCPNCGAAALGLGKLADLPGERIWVDKNALEWRSPKRWEAVVFRGPDAGATPFVKRVVGLSEETVQLKDGDVYIDGLLERKRIDDCRETSFLIYDGRYPARNCWNLDRFVSHNGGQLDFRGARREAVARFQLPAVFTTGPATDYCVYNGAKVPRVEPVHDFRVTFDVTIDSFSGSLEVTLFDGATSAQAVLLTDLHQEGPWLGIDNAVETAQDPLAMQIGSTYRVDFTFYDRRASLCVNEAWRSWRDAPPATDREPVTTPLTIRAKNMNASISNICVFRDAHYQSAGRHGIRVPYRLGPDEYFVLGDNSANSDDSRFWPTPGVKLTSLIGRPVLRK